MKLFYLLKVLCAILMCASISFTAQAAIRGPYLQNATKTSIAIHWRTSSSHIGVVKYGTSVDNLNLTVTEPRVASKHVLTVSGLKPNTKYYYQIGNAATSVFEKPANQEEQFFKTNPSGPKATRIWVLGDPGTGTSNQRAVRDAYYTLSTVENRETDIVLALGDNAYGNGTDSQYGSNFFDTYQDMFQKAPVWSTQGNHERNMDVYLDVFSHPTNGEGGGVASGSELYYSFNYGDIHFVCLDSYGSAIDNTAGAPQFQWLAQDLAVNTKKWVIAFWHHPPYSYTSSHNADSERDLVRMRENAVEVLENAGVDLVLSGHNHHYDRTQFINGHYGKSNTFDPNIHVVQAGDGNAVAYEKSDNRGATYVMTGSAGKNNTYTIIDKPVTQVAFDRLGSFVIDLNAANTELTMRMLRNNGSVDDSFRIVKQPPGNRAPVANAGADGQVRIPKVFTLMGSVTDDGFTGFPVTTTWSQIAGPAGGANFTDVKALNTDVSFAQAGTYTLRLAANDGEFNNTDDVVVTVAPAPVNAAPVTSAGSDDSVNISATYTLMGLISDDGFAGFPVTSEWSQVAGPARGATFVNPRSVTSDVTFTQLGSYTLRLSANDGEFTDSDDVVIEVVPDPVNMGPRVMAGVDQEIPIAGETVSVELSGNVVDDNFPGTTLITTWDANSADVSFDDIHAVNTTATIAITGGPASMGEVIFTLRASDGEFAASDRLTVKIINNPPLAKNDVAETALNTAVTIDVLANDSDPNSQAIKLDSVEPPKHGETNIVNGSVYYVPEKDYAGSDTFSYQISDSFGLSATATVNVSVGATDVGIGSVSSTAGDRSVFSFDHTVAGSMPLLVVGVQCDGGNAESDVSYAGMPMTLIASETNAGAKKPGIAVYQQIAPPEGTAQVRATLDGGSDKCVVGAMTLLGVEQTKPVTDVVGASGSSASTNVSVASQNHHIVLEWVASGASGSPTAQSGQTGHYALEMGGQGSSDHYAVLASKISDQNMDVGMSHRYPERKEWVGIVINVKASVGSAPSEPDTEVSITASDATASERNLDTGTFTFSRKGDTSAALLVEYMIAGSATMGKDYQALSGSVTIDAGLFSAELVLVPIDDSVDEEAETVELVLKARPEYSLGASSSATVTIASDDSVGNIAPLASAGPDGSVQIPNAYALNGMVSDDNFPGKPVIVTWSLISGPESGQANFANINAATTNVSFDRAGRYTLQLSADDGEFNSRDDIVISVASAAVNTAPVANAGLDISIDITEPLSLAGTVSDDAFVGFPLASTWSQVSGPAGGVNFTDKNVANTSVSFVETGIYTLRLTAGDGEYSHSDDVVVTVSEATKILAKDDSARVNTNETANINVLINDTASANGALILDSVSIPQNGQASIVNGLIVYTPNKDYSGSDSFTYTVVDGSGESASATVRVTVSSGSTGGAIDSLGLWLLLSLVLLQRVKVSYKGKNS